MDIEAVRAELDEGFETSKISAVLWQRGNVLCDEIIRLQAEIKRNRADVARVKEA